MHLLRRLRRVRTHFASMVPSDRFPIRRFIVVEDSMRPGLEPGQGVIGVRWPWARPHQRRIVVHPDNDMLLVKRLGHRCDDGRWWVTADNPLGRDSADFGPVALQPSWLVIVAVPRRWM